uniref:Uncharacterized protein n=1 Tax=Oryza meridionalis TaxID=40149 RepID=A0A0E0EQM3_9ORYZ
MRFRDAPAPPPNARLARSAAAACCSDDAWSASESATIDLHQRSQLSSSSGSLCSIYSWTPSDDWGGKSGT